MSEASVAIDTSLFDPSVTAADDFYRRVNGGWLDANPVPPEYGSWGAFHEVNERNQQLLRRLFEQASEAAAAGGSDAAAFSPVQLVGDYYAVGDGRGRDRRGGRRPAGAVARPHRRRHVGRRRPRALRDLQRIGVSALHSLGVESDFENNDAYLVYVGQGGLGLPERDYYLRDDERSTRCARPMSAHVANQLANLGDDAGAARDAADRILAFETRLAEASYPAEKMRDVQLTTNRFEIAALDDLMPDFGLAGYAPSSA